MKKALVFGAGGFIGSHMVTRLKSEGYYVRGVDIKYPDFESSDAYYFILQDLSKQDGFAELLQIDKGIFDEIYQYAADIGGAGYIFSGENDANVIISYQNERLKDRVIKLKNELGIGSDAYPCDLSQDSEILTLKNNVIKDHGNLDGIIHSAAFAPKELLSGKYIDNITREGFTMAHDISSYSLTALTRAFKDNLNKSASIITLSIFLYSTVYSQNFMLKDVTNVEKDTIYSTKDISLVTGLVLDYFENGMIKLYAEYKNGLKNGEFKKWHSNGQLIFKGNYIDGVKDGVYEEFDIYGKKILKIKYNEGIVLWEKDYTEKYR